ncbi:MAG: phosphoglycerate kinase [Candidatus Paceibacterota bacterium]|jgi:3-phosphoglycerate kinase
MKNLRDINVNGKKVLVRCDFNVPINESGNISDVFRIKKAIPTIKYLSEHGATVILISHLGDPVGIDLKCSLSSIAEKLSDLMKIKVNFLSQEIGLKTKDAINNMVNGQVVLLENLRFNKGEKENNPDFAKVLASLADIFVEDGFGVCHREHASVVGVAKLLPSYPGFLLEEEVKIITKAMEAPERPFVSIIGGVKISSKTKLIEKFLEKSDNILVGGKIANSILVVRGICIKDKWTSEEDKLIAVANRLDLTSPKLHLPIDGVMGLSDSEEYYTRVGAVGTVRKEEDIYDIGPETIEKFKDIISEAKTIIWNGPLGFFERDEYRNGTKEIMKAIADSPAYSIIGGGETADIIHREKMEDKFNHISSGGGAMLDFISDGTLPGIAVLENN